MIGVMLDDLGAFASARLFSEGLASSFISLVSFEIIIFARNCFY
jgi:hypothetical protein